MAAQAVCGTPGKDGPGGTLAGIVNTYYPGLTASASGASAITLGPATGATATITPGDLLLIIQMQDASINSGNNSGYGAGTTTGNGSTNLNNSGRYEYATATNSVGAGGGSLTFRGTGAGNGLLNTYSNAAATPTQGQRRYQVVRVPQYSQATLGSSLTAGFWNGTTGGILAIDVAGQLTLGGTVSVDGRGFRGGAGTGASGGAGGSNADYVNLSSNPFHGIKGEGLAGTPRWVIDPRTNTNLDLGFEGYPAGDAARGAPATAGGGGTDGNPGLNDQNSGGGGGSNGGAGGQGGLSWSSALDIGGRGGAAFLVGAVNRVVLGGGGGAGSRNNSVAPANGGGAGGGMVLMRAGTVAGVGTITANGLPGNSPANDGAGGGGAGGTIVLLTTNDGLGGLTAQARGGRGGDAWIGQAGAGSAHGPGGGGGGGTVILSGATTVDVAGGGRGNTTTGLLPYGATNGIGGRSLIAALATAPGTSAGVVCVPALTVTKTTTTATITNGPSGTTATYRIVAANAANRDTARSVVLLDTLPTGFTYASSSPPVLAGGASRPTTADPAVGAPIPQWTTFSIPAGGSVSQTFVVTVASSVPNGVYNNPARAIYLDPARTTPTGTTSAAYNPAGAGENVTVWGPDLTVTKTHAGPFTVGGNGVYTIRVRNSGTAASSGTVTVTDTLPAGLTYGSGTGTAWTCGAAGQIITCTRPNAINAGSNAPNITLTVSVGVAAAPSVTNGVTALGGGEPTGNEGNNTATDPTTVNVPPASVPPANVATTKTGPASAAAGANVVYTVSTTNAGPNDAVNVVISDTLPAGATFGSASDGGTLAGNVVTWPTIDTLASGAPAVVRTVTVSYTAAGSYQNLAASQAASVDPIPANNNGSAAGARVTTVVSAAADVSISKTGPATAPAATNVGYTLTVSNAGPSVATNVVVTDTLPAGAVFVAATGGGTLAGNVVTWPAIASLAVGAPASVTVTLSFAAGGSFTNVAAATSSSTDPNPANNRTTAVTAVATIADVVTTKSGPVSVVAGATTVYTVTATNNGPDAATAVVITDTLPAGATFVAATGGGTVSGSVVSWPAVASIAHGANASFSVTVTFAAAGAYLNLAASTSPTADPALANNNGSAGPARVSTTVTPSADVAVTNVGPANATAGTNVAYTITATNNGPSTATNVVVTDTLPAGATFVSASGGGTLAGTVVTWPVVPSLASGASSGYTLTVSYPASGTYPNAAAATTSSPDPDLTNNRAVATTAVATSADVVTTKTGPAGVAAGVAATYSITVQNNGPSVALNVIVTDTLPAGATFVSATGSGAVVGNVVTWPAVASIANGATANFSVTVTFGTAGSYLNLAASEATTPDPLPANNNGSAGGARATTTVTPSADVAVANVGPAAATAGTNVAYTITVSNSGPSPAANVVVTDTLPAGATFVSASGGGTLAGNVVTWPAIASVASGASTSYTLTLTYAAAGSYSNVAAAGSTTPDPNLADNAAPASTVVSTSADVVTTKSGPATVVAGANATYTITALNNGPSAATNVVVTDTLPAGATFVSATGGGTVAGSVVTWPAVVSIANGGNASFDVTVTFAAGGSYQDLAASTSPTPDPTPANNDGSAGGARVTTSVTPSADLAVTNVGPALVTAGAPAVYTITATNNGPSTAAAVVVTDTLPAGAAFVTATGGGILSGNVVSWPAIGSLASGASTAFTMTVTYAAAGSYANAAAVGSATSDPNLANNRAPATTTVDASADVVTTKSGPVAASAGQNITYTITTLNAGPSAAVNVVVTDTLPAGLAFVSASNGGILTGNVVSWPAIASLAAAASQNYTVVAQAASGGTYTNIVASTATTPDPTPANNDGSDPGARAVTAVTAVADVAVTKTGPATATAGLDFSYTITVSSVGPSAAVNVVVVDTLPAGLIFVSASGAGGFSSGVVTFPAIASLASGGSATYTVTVRATSGGTYTNVAAGSSPTADPDPTNNDGSSSAARVSTIVATSADVATTKTGPAGAAAGQDIPFTITTINNGPSTAANVVITDTLPAGLTFVSASNGGTLAGNVVTWPTVPSLANGASVSFTLATRAANGGGYVNIAASTATTPDPVSANNNGSAPGAQATVPVVALADVATTKSGPATGIVDQNLTFTVVTTNDGPSAAVNVVVTDTLPVGLAFVSASGGGTLAGNVVTWPTIGSLAAGGSQSVAVVVRPTAVGTFVNFAASSAATADPTPANNNGSAPAARATVDVAPSADLVTTKTGPAAATAGLDINYTITTLNNGPSAATGVVISDTLPAGLTFVSASNGGALAAGVVTWPAIASLANGASVSYTVVARASNAGSYLNLAASTATTPDPTPADNDGSAPNARTTTVVTGSADVVTTKTGPATATAGQDVVYTITALNNGPSTALDVVVSDTLPAGAALVSASNGGVLAGNVVTWPAVPTLANGVSLVYTLTVRYAAAAGYLNVAANTSTTADPVPANNNGSAAPARVVTVIGASADVVTMKTGPGAAAAGQDVPYTISTTNNGPSTAVDVVVTDTLQAGAIFVSATAGGTVAGNVIRWPAVASLVSGGNVTYGAVVRYLVPGNYLNLAASSSPTPDPTPANNDGSLPSGRVNTAIGPSADVVTTKTGPATANAGQNIPYTITVTNNGPTPATDVVVTDTLPAGFTFVTATAGGTLTGNVVTWPAVVSLANGASATFTVTARATAAGSFVNLAATTATSPDPDLSNNDGSQPAARVTTVVGLLSDVVTTKTGPATAAVSQPFSYVITVQNNGPSVATNVVVTDTLPAGLTFINANAGGTLAGTVVTWPSIASLAAGASVNFAVTVRADAAGSFTNLAASSATTPDPTLANNNGQAPAARVLTVVSSTADLRVTKTGPSVRTIGQDIGYTITVFNDGPAAASGVVVTDTVPAGATFVAATGGGVLTGNVVTWPALASLPAGSFQSYTVTLRGAAIGTITNVAAAGSPAPDPTPANNRATAITAVTAAAVSADLITTKSGPATAAAGGAVVYTIQTINAGPNAAADVAISDTLPAGVTFVSATGSPTRTGNILSWPIIPSLANGASVTFTVTLQAPASGSFTNIAASTSPTPDPNPANNNGSTTTSRVVTTITATADLVTTKTGPATAGVGGQITYTIGTRNAGPDAAANVVVTDSLPAGALFVSASNGGVFADGVVTWPTLASLPNGATLTHTLTLIIPNVSQVVNVARSTSTTADPIPGNNRGTATTTITASADVVTTKTGPSRVDAGATITYTIKSKNLGPQTAVAVTVIDSLPAAVTFVSATDGGSLAGRVVTWPVIPALASGDSVVYTVVVTAPNGAAQLKNVVASTATTEDPNPGNNNGTGPGGIVITDVSPIDLAVAKAHNGDFIPGAIATYTITVTNVGPVPTIGPVTMTDTLPAGLTYRSFTGAGWNCSNLGRVVTCRFDTVPFAVGATTTVSLKVLVGGTAANTVVNRVVISTPGDTDESGNNVATDSAPLQRVSPLVIEKVASRSDAEVGDVIDYTVIVTNRTASEVPDVSVTDILPRGFTYQRSTARVDLIPIADPVGAPGPKLTFAAGNLGPNASFRLTYRVKLGAGATLGDGANRAQAKSGTGLESPVAIAVVRVSRGVFTDRGIIFGKVYLTRHDSIGPDSSRAEVRDSVGVPGVRIFLEDGTSVVTDLEGKYNLYGIVSGLHVVKVDPTTLPGGARLIDLDSRNARDGSSRFVDLKNGELHKADFAVRFIDSVGATIGFRRDRGEITGVIIDSLAGTDRGGQDRPVVAVDAASDTAQAEAYRPLSAQSSANPIDEANRLPVSRLPGTTVPLTAIPNGSVELTPARRSLPADGNTAIAVRVKVLDRDRNLVASEQPITLEASLGRWLAQDLDPVEPGVQAMLANGQGDFTLVASSEAGVGEIRVTNGLRINTAQIVFLPATRPMLVNGLVEARIDLRSLLKNGLTQVTASDRFERELQDLRTTSDDGRVTAAARGALFLQGKVKGSTLLTLAYDTEGDPERRMFRDIQPDEFYPVYGDASIKEFGAQSFDRLYVRVDADRSFALYGDYVTPSAGNGALAARELGAYQRSLTGALGHAEGRVGQLNVFASRDRLSQVVEEIPGQGISGPYQLRRSDGRINSEKVEILTRDRNQPSRIIASVQLARFTDYTLEPFTGRLLFFAPVASVDADLNPVSIRVLYEVERAGQEFWVYGADGQVKLGDKAEIGGGIVRDEQPESNRKLYSANAAVQVAPGTVLVAEVAHTDGDSASFRGGAARFELRHASAKFQGTVFGATSDSGFSNQSSTFQRGRSELGIRGSAVLDERTRFIGEALRSDDKVSGRRRDGFLASFERQFGKSVRAELGYRFGRDSLNETNALRTRVTVQVPGQPRASVFGEFEQDLKESDQRRGALGGQYVLFDRLRLYGRHEFLSSFAGPFALNGSERQATTVIGLDAGYTKDGQFFGEYRASDAFSGRQTEAAIGLRNRWNLRRGLVLNTGFERVDVLKGVGQGEATAVTAGVEYTTSPLWRGTARVEYRFAPNAAGDNFLATLGYARKLDRDWTVLGRALYNTFGDGGKRTRNQVGFAWRETDRNRWNGLARWENRFERLAPSGGDATVQKTNILSAHLNYQPLRSVWMSGRLAGKWATDESNGLVSTNRAVLGSVRALYDFLPSWDAGLIGSMLSSNGRQYGAGVELGRTVITNMRVAVGYNVFGFKNQDLTSDGATTDRGFYLHFGFKFSEDLFKRQQ